MQQRRTEPKGGNEGKSTQYQEQRTDGYPRKRGALPLGDVTINGEQQPRDPYCRVRMRPKQPCGNEPAHHVTDAREQRGAHCVPGARKQVHAQPSNCQVEQDRKIKADSRIRRYSENQESRCQLGMYRVDQPSHASRPHWIPPRKMTLKQLSTGVQ